MSRRLQLSGLQLVDGIFTPPEVAHVGHAARPHHRRTSAAASKRGRFELRRRRRRGRPAAGRACPGRGHLRRHRPQLRAWTTTNCSNGQPGRRSMVAGRGHAGRPADPIRAAGRTARRPGPEHRRQAPVLLTCRRLRASRQSSRRIQSVSAARAGPRQPGRPRWCPRPATRSGLCPLRVRAEHAAAGDPLPAQVPPGPDNPLGNRRAWAWVFPVT